MLIETSATSPLIGGLSFLMTTLNSDLPNASFNRSIILWPTDSINLDRMAISSLTMRFTWTYQPYY